MTTPFTDVHAYPYYPENISYCTVAEQLRPWEFSGWKPESLSWKESCYIHTGLSGPLVIVEGPEADEFVSWLCTNNLQNIPQGTMRHAVMCDEHGLIAAHGILQRYDDGRYKHFAAGPWAMYQGMSGRFNVKVSWVPQYLTQVAGPRSLEALQRACGEDLSDIGFLRYRNTRIAGHVVEIGRVGMSGNLAYEVRGPMEEGADVFDAIYRVNRDIGIERLGWRTYLVNHVEGGFPQMMWTMGTSMVADHGFRDWIGRDHFALRSNRSGSVDPEDLRSRLRNPFEVNWDRAVRFDHEFLGRDALEKVSKAPKRRTVTLRWNSEDVVDIHASLFRPGEEYRTMELPTTPSWKDGMLEHADHVLHEGRRVGVSSGTIYSYYFRECLSMGCLDPEAQPVGTELEVQWGHYGKRIKNVRVTVDRFPLLSEERNIEVVPRVGKVV